MNLRDDILMSIDYGYSKREIFNDLVKKGYSKEEINREIESVYPSLEPLNKNSFRFIFSLIVITLLSLSFLIGFFIMHELIYIILTLAFLFLSFDFYRLKTYALYFWGILFSLIDLFLIIILISLLFGAEYNSSYTLSHVFPMLLFINVVLYNIGNIILYNMKRACSLNTNTDKNS